ncbi:HutD family protein [Acinetobacter bereziniae]|uniref:HutD/Ves family protein n=1 Tax=Acinetobacter bereziniae TaxID=106648 RepID=UPI0021CF5327|nr:HutD family protein [Acinetobacter bereziniae]MCU4433979.1 HutD family protein [Acinetobacter bereziniae]MDA3438727.1 HutD family protein [Acinetobacter bereziniae]
MIELLEIPHYKKMRWKNGEGYTLEIARSVGESLDEFEWRISMADIKSAGSFSKFNGMQRFLTVLEGQGISLNIDSELKYLHTLQSVSFSGESEVYCELFAGQIRDFNLIYDPQKISAQYQWIFTQERLEIPISSDFIFVFNQSIKPLEVTIDEKIFYLQHQNCLKIQHENLAKIMILNPQFSPQTCLIQLTKI